MIETIEKSVKKETWLEKYKQEFGWSDNYDLDDKQIEFLSNSHLALLEDLIKREEGEMKDWLSKFMLNHQEENDEWGNGYANAYKEAKTDTITHLKSLQEQITSLRR